MPKVRRLIAGDSVPAGEPFVARSGKEKHHYYRWMAKLWAPFFCLFALLAALLLLRVLLVTPPRM